MIQSQAKAMDATWKRRRFEKVVANYAEVFDPKAAKYDTILLRMSDYKFLVGYINYLLREYDNGQTEGES